MNVLIGILIGLSVLAHLLGILLIGGILVHIREEHKLIRRFLEVTNDRLESIRQVLLHGDGR